MLFCVIIKNKKKEEVKRLKENEIIIEGKVKLLGLRIVLFVIIFIAFIIMLLSEEIDLFGFIICVPSSFLMIFLITNMIFGGCQIVVTEDKVYGIAIFGNRVDIPLDSISAVNYFDLFSVVGVSSASDTIRFPFIPNAKEVHTKINELIINRQDNKKILNNDNVKVGAPEELKKYKELLDMGAITQEEYDKKKKKILNL